MFDTNLPEIKNKPVSAIKDTDETIINSNGNIPLLFLNTLFQSYSEIPPYWSIKRDEYLRDLSLKDDIFNIVYHNLSERLFAVLPTIIPFDSENEIETLTANISNQFLLKSWLFEIPKFLRDLNTQDNGAFLEILSGGGESNTPLESVKILPTITLPALGFRHLDSQRCIRQNNKEFPVIYIGLDGKSYVLHHSRVVEKSQNPSPDEELRGIGFCTLSRVSNSIQQQIATNKLMLDNLTLGRLEEIIFASPFDSSFLQSAINSFIEDSKIKQKLNTPVRTNSMIIGTQPGQENSQLKIERIPLRKLIDNFDREKEIKIWFTSVAAAFGIDVREIVSSIVGVPTRADSETNELRNKNKTLRSWFNFWNLILTERFIPRNTRVVIENKDIEESIRLAEYRKLFTETITSELNNGTMTKQIAIMQYHKNGFISHEEMKQILDKAS